MKALDWMRFLEVQHKQHGKVLFRVAELANVAGRNPHALNVELARLVKKAVVERYATGVYGLPGRVTPEQLVSALDEGAYLTGAYALYRHNLITQMPSEITCFTNRRHNRSRRRVTSLGTLAFIRVAPGIYRKPAEGALAPPGQALCDFIHMTTRQGIEPSTLVTFRQPTGLIRGIPTSMLKRYPSKVARIVREMA